MADRRGMNSTIAAMTHLFFVHLKELFRLERCTLGGYWNHKVRFSPRSKTRRLLTGNFVG